MAFLLRHMTWGVVFFLSFVKDVIIGLCWITDLHAGLGEINPACQILPDEGIGVMRPLKHPLQGLQLTAVERGPVSPLLPLLLLLRVQLLI